MQIQFEKKNAVNLIPLYRHDFVIKLAQQTNLCEILTMPVNWKFVSGDEGTDKQILFTNNLIILSYRKFDANINTRRYSCLKVENVSNRLNLVP